MGATVIRHTGIVVKDMEQSLRFYRDLLGLEVWADFTDNSEYVQTITGVQGADLWMIKLKAPGGGSVELLKYQSHLQDMPTPRQSYDVGINHIAIQVDDIDALHRKLTSEGIAFNAPPTLSSDNAAKVTYCRDPEGVIVELVEILD